jgi:DNA-binding NtrC family response regulator
MDKKTLLIVDDECDIRSLCRCVVSRSFEGFEVIDAPSIADAKHLLSAYTPDVVLLDLEMNDGIGFDLIPYLKKVNPDVKILIVTAYNQCEERQKAVQLGTFGLLGKPFRSEDLVERIHQMIK